MNSSYELRNYLLRVGVISYKDFGKVVEDPDNYKASVFSLSQVLEVNLKSNCVGNLELELAERVCKAWSKQIFEKCVKRAVRAVGKVNDRKKLKGFMVWANGSRRLAYADTKEAFYKNFLGSDLKAPEEVKRKRSSSLSASSSAKKLLSTYSSKPLLNSFTESRQTPTLTPHDRLYSHAASKEASLERTRKQKNLKELEECTFKPSITSSNDRIGSVFERLHQSHTNDRELIYQKQREFKETKGCTFTPKINSTKSLHYSERLEKDPESSHYISLDKEILNEESSRKQTVNFSGSIVTGNVYEKLYNDFQEKQREWKRKNEESREGAEVQFVKNQEGFNEGDGFSRLYDEALKRKEKVRKASEERQRSTSATRTIKKGEVPRYEHLYLLHKNTQERKAILQERYLKESGVIFKPNLQKSGSFSKKREFSPKFEYPMPRKPDTSARSNYN